MFRIGHGYDVHRLCGNRKLILGGVEIPSSKGLLGHSDADVLTHAIIDAIFGALSLGDIGQHFPDSDENYKDISSLLLLKKTAEIMQEKGFIIGNIDSTVICEAPKLAKFIDEIRKELSDVLECDISQVSVKATTEEGLGVSGCGDGKEKGIAAHAVVLLTNLNSE
ncbi:MAG: 2-C-methyl-D-erythritol 2,4-cyclodiphosphate synthase [Ruminococcus sp.]|jgi:2-C-methyl-D-erythritol 2,4-cyclodiphosphate synthase|nr:2-C-methyl-D-erythritol 2,4-cyclodiphosphate synthase [Ruminococcus sp.]